MPFECVEVAFESGKPIVQVERPYLVQVRPVIISQLSGFGGGQALVNRAIKYQFQDKLLAELR